MKPLLGHKERVHFITQARIHANTAIKYFKAGIEGSQVLILQDYNDLIEKLEKQAAFVAIELEQLLKKEHNK